MIFTTKAEYGVRLLVQHGADIASPFEDGSTPAERAATAGRPELARYLVEHAARRAALGA